LEGEGALDSNVRSAAAEGIGLEERPGAFVKKVHAHAYKVTDNDIASLLRAGYSEDQVYELIVSAALGAGLAVSKLAGPRCKVGSRCGPPRWNARNG
jgi:hypothetical protein